MFRLLLAMIMAGVLPAATWASEAAPAVAAGEESLMPANLDVAAILPPPPAPDTPAGRADLETVLQVQAARTPEQIAWAEEIEEENVFANADAIGPWFTAKNLPATAAFFAKVEADYARLGVKKRFERPRPPYADARVQPCVRFSRSSSYPSGHAVRAWLWAEVLAAEYPEARAALEARARAVCWGRVIGGVHYPSDVAAGEMLAKALAAAMLKTPAVQAALEKCRAEAAPFRLKKAA